jgi:site-specific DNA recombinase
MSQLQERHQAAREAAETKRDLALVISRLEDFSAKVATSFNNLDRSACRISFVLLAPDRNR